MTARIAILGGTFDPIHLGHLAIAADVQHALQTSCVLFVPAAQQPFKLETHTTSAQDRLAMVRLAVADNPAFDVSTVEIERGGISYTVETVSLLRELYADAELFFIVGADAALDVPRWYKAEQLVQLCRLAIVQRPGFHFELDTLYQALPVTHGRITLLSGPAFDMSASDIRQRVRAGLPVRYHLHPAVYTYIQQHHLYVDTES